jgi:peptidoglycan hydrolase-like protein with peptidoglycan-binding domain
MMPGRTLIAGGAVLLAAGAVAIAGFLWTQASPPAAAPPVAPAATAKVVRGALRDTKTVAGTLSYGELSALRPSLADASAMVTWIAPVGSTVARGEPLYTLDGQPAILFYGSAPQHRTLRFEVDTAAPVWVELEQAKTAVESATLTLQLEESRLADAEARAADADARLADALSGAPAMSEFIQLAGTVRAAEARVSRVRELAAAELAPAIDVAAAETDLAVAHAASDAAIRVLRRDLSAAGLDAVTARVAVAEARVKLDAVQSILDALAARSADNADIAQLGENLAALGYEGPLHQQVRAWQRAAGLPVTGIVGPSQLVIAEGPVHIAAHSASVGETLVASSPERGSILDYSTTEKLVTVPLSVGDQALAAVGRAVILTLPDDSEVEGTISEIGSVVTGGTIDVTIAIADQTALGALEVASVDVEFVSDSRDDVLSVPVTALLARPEGGFAVEVVTDGASVVVPVDTGLFAAGRVEVSGDGIAEGTRVGVPG